MRRVLLDGAHIAAPSGQSIRQDAAAGAKIEDHVAGLAFYAILEEALRASYSPGKRG